MRWSLKHLTRLWKLGLVSRAIVTAFILSLLIAPVRRSCRELLPFIWSTWTAHLYLAFLLITFGVTAASILWFIVRWRRGKGFDTLSILSLALAFVGILASIVPSFSSAEFRNQLGAAIAFSGQRQFWHHHIVTIVLILVTLSLWGPVIIALANRLSVRSKLNQALLLASFRHQDHIEEAVAKAAGAHPSPLDVQLYATVVESYSTAAAHLAQYGTEAPLLPGTFDTYAQCVKGILDFVTRASHVPTVSIYTLLKRPVWDWYNPLTAMVNGDDGVTAAAFTRPWWERYKLNVAQLKNQRGPGQKLRMKRLVLQWPPNNSDSSSVAKSLFLLTNGNARTHVEPYALDDVPKVGRVEGTPEMHLLPEIERIINANADDRPEHARVHVIGEYQAAKPKQVPSKRFWTNLINHFQDAYHSKSVKAERQSTGSLRGIFYGYVKSIEPDFYAYAKNYDDLFLVKLHLVDGSDELFGIAFIDDKTGDEVGIRFLDNEEIQRMGQAFEKQWNYVGTVEQFVFCTDQVL